MRRRRSVRTDCDPPQPVEPWDEVYDALAFGPKSPQVAYSPGIAEGIPERSAKARTA
jgi:carboxylesterase type B